MLVGVGQVTSRPDPEVAVVDRPEPIELMATALRRAAEDATGAAEGAGGPGRRLLEGLNRLEVVSCLGWRAVNPALLVAERLGIEPGRTVVSAIGGTMPLSLLHDACRAIAAGDADAVAVVGAECMYTRSRARRDPDHPVLTWAVQPAEGTPEPDLFGVDRAPATELEMQRGIVLPVHAYPLFEQALRGAAGRTVDEHRAVIGALWHRFAEVAATNPYAWITDPPDAGTIVTPSPANRMIASPYTKLCTANMPVDQGAGFLCCSVAAARAAGIPEDRWVFPLAGADAHDHWFVSHRPELDRSPALRLAGAAALAMAGVGVDDLAAVDLYSCFPCVVQMAAGELGLPLGDPDRPLTLTGGLTFFGGPGNNYATHGLAAMVGRLRREPGAVGLTTGLGWYATKHAVTVLASRPPAGGGTPFAWRDVQDEVDVLPQCRVDSEATGPVTVETYTVTYDRQGEPERGIVACRTAEGARAWANVTDADHLAELAGRDALGVAGTLRPGGVLTLP